MLYDQPLTDREKYDRLKKFIDHMYRKAQGEFYMEGELHAFVRDEDDAKRHRDRMNKAHDAFKLMKVLDEYVDALEEVPTYTDDLQWKAVLFVTSDEGHHLERFHDDEKMRRRCIELNDWGSTSWAEPVSHGLADYLRDHCAKPEEEGDFICLED